MSEKEKITAGADVDVGTTKDVEDIMRKYDRESNTRIWEGMPALIVRIITVAISVYCICSTLFSVAALEKRLTAFLGLIIVIGYRYDQDVSL